MNTKVVMNLVKKGIVPIVRELSEGKTLLTYKRAGKVYSQTYNRLGQVESFSIKDRGLKKFVTGVFDRNAAQGAAHFTRTERTADQVLTTTHTNFGDCLEISHSKPLNGIVKKQVYKEGDIYALGEDGIWELKRLGGQADEIEAVVVDPGLEMIGAERSIGYAVEEELGCTDDALGLLQQEEDIINGNNLMSGLLGFFGGLFG